MHSKRESVACNLNALPYATGTEGMYADLGHFNIRAIQVIAALLLASTVLFFTLGLFSNVLAIFSAEVSERKYLTVVSALI